MVTGMVTGTGNGNGHELVENADHKFNWMDLGQESN